MNSHSVIRGEIVARRTYHRVRDDGRIETWREVIDRVISYSKWLDASAGLKSSSAEFEKLRVLFEAKRAFPAGRTLWLGGTETARRRAACNFNCSALKLQTVHDYVDVMWLLLQGCGVGCKLVPGTLTGFAQRIDKVTIHASTREDSHGMQHNMEMCGDGRWTIVVGDTAEAWAKSIGKLLSRKTPVTELFVDLSQIRPAGGILKGYGWVCVGNKYLAEALRHIIEILNDAAGRALTHIEMLDIFTLLGTVLSSRRSAEIALYPYGADGWKDFAQAKNNVNAQPWRAQSNNTLTFEEFPGEKVVGELIDTMIAGGNGEPGFLNMEAAKKRAPWCEVQNPCAEILLADKGFCNLSELVLPAFESLREAEEAAYLLGRHNYRQTLVDFNDGILQPEWHNNNQELRLCGVGLTGIQQAPNLSDNYSLSRLRRAAQAGAYSLAREAGTAIPGNVTTVKPSGTLSKVAGCSEGAHFPIAPYLFNHINFSQFDPMVKQLEAAGYTTAVNPYDASAVIITLPVSFVAPRYLPDVTAVAQLEEYRRLMACYCDQNVSMTISYSDSERDSIVMWLCRHWNKMVAVSFLPRQDGRKQSYLYVPQEVVSADAWHEYANKLCPVSWPDSATPEHSAELETSSDCSGGVCPVR